MKLKRNFNPETHKLDERSMKKVLGAPDECRDTLLLKQTFIKLVEEQLEEIKNKEKNYKFLKKFDSADPDDHLNDQIGDVEKQLL